MPTSDHDVLVEVLRRLTYRCGDGVIRRSTDGQRLDTILPEAMYRALDRMHPPLEDDREDIHPADGHYHRAVQTDRKDPDDG